MSPTTPPATAATLQVCVPHVLSETNVRWYLGTQLISLTGLMLRTAVLPLFIIAALGEDNAPPWIGIILALNMLPGAIFSSFAGTYIDRYDKRKILFVTAIIGIVQAIALAIVTSGDPHKASMWNIVVIMAFTGVTNMIDGICRNAIVADAVIHQKNIGPAAKMFTTLYTLAMIVGNSIAGFLVVNIGYPGSFVLNGASFLVLIYGLNRLNFDHHTSRKVKSRCSFKEGATYTFSHPTLRICILIAGTVTVFGFAYNAMMSVVARQMFEGGPTVFSFLAFFSGIGSLTGSLIAIVCSKKRTVMFAIAGFFLSGAAHIAASRATSLNMEAAAMFMCGFGFMTAFVPIRGTIMHVVDPGKSGAVLGITFNFFYGGMMVSSIASGWIVKFCGCRTLLFGCGIALLILTLALPFLPGIKNIDDDPKK